MCPHPNWGHPDHDACGTGFVARLGGAPNHDIIEHALTALERLTHRGGVDADGASGDGAGLLTSIPEAFFRTRAQEHGIALPQVFRVGFGSSTKTCAPRLLRPRLPYFPNGTRRTRSHHGILRSHSGMWRTTAKSTPLFPIAGGCARRSARFARNLPPARGCGFWRKTSAILRALTMPSSWDCLKAFPPNPR